MDIEGSTFTLPKAKPAEVGTSSNYWLYAKYLGGFLILCIIIICILRMRNGPSSSSSINDKSNVDDDSKKNA